MSATPFDVYAVERVAALARAVETSRLRRSPRQLFRLAKGLDRLGLAQAAVLRLEQALHATPWWRLLLSGHIRRDLRRFAASSQLAADDPRLEILPDRVACRYGLDAHFEGADLRHPTGPGGPDIQQIVDGIARLRRDDPALATAATTIFASGLTANVRIPPVTTDPTVRRRRICYIPNSRMPTPAANNVHVARMTSALARAGVEVALHFTTPEAIDVETAHSRLRELLQPSPDVELRPAARSGSHVLDALHHVAEATAEGCDAVYARSIWAAYFASLLDVPTVLELHLPVPDSSAAAFTELTRTSGFQGVVTITNALRRHVLDEFGDSLPGEAVVVFADGADPVAPPPAADRSVADRTITVGYLGSFYLGKGVEHVIAIAAACPEYRFVLAGGDADDVARIRSEGIPSNVTLHQRMPHADALRIISTFDIALLPNQPHMHVRDSEVNAAAWTSPLKMFEYMAAGQPVVASDLPALREVLTDGRNALLCPPESVDAWVTAIRRLASDQQLRHTIGVRAYDDLRNLYSWDVRASRALALLLAQGTTSRAERSAIAGRSDDSATRADQGRHSVPALETDPGSRAVPASRRPSVLWLVGSTENEEGADAVNARELAERLPDFNHTIGPHEHRPGTRYDIKISSDVVIHLSRTAQDIAARRSIVRVGGSLPFQELNVRYPGLAPEQALNGVDAVIAPTPDLARQVVEWHPNVMLVPDGVNRLDAPHDSSTGDTWRGVVGMAASPHEVTQNDRRCLRIAVDACRRAGVRLRVVGGDGERLPLELMRTEFYAQIDALIHPAGPGEETSSNTIVEALANGVPVVTTRHAIVHGAVLRHGIEALIASHNAAAIAACIEALATDDGLRQRLADGGSDLVATLHSLDAVADGHRRLFCRLLT